MDFKERLNNVFKENNIEIIEYTGDKQKISYKCNNCGQIYQFSTARGLFEKRTLCKNCYDPFKRWNIERIQERLNRLFPESQLEVLEYHNKKAKIKCLKCGETEEIKNISAVFCGRKDNFCKNCEQKIKVFEKQKVVDVNQDFNSIQEELSQNNEYKLLQYKKNSNRCLIKHKCGFIYTIKKDKIPLLLKCPKCKNKIN